MNENRDALIRETIDRIEPSDGARERMLANIRQKAAAQETPAQPEAGKVLPFRRAAKWALPLAACFAITVIGVIVMPKLFHTTEPVDPGPEVQVVNPFVPVEDAAAFERELGITIDAPESAENVSYTIIDGRIADIDFTESGHKYDLRASMEDGDFSGLLGVTANTEQIDAAADAVLTVIRIDDELCTKITWTDGRVTYILSNTDGASEAEIKTIYKKLK